MALEICKITDCDSIAKSLGWCPKHYGRWKRNGDPLKITRTAPFTYMICIIDGCNRKVYGKGLCSRHYQRMWAHGDPLAPVLEHFHGADWEQFVVKNGPVPIHNPGLGPCWIWLRMQMGGGYGGFHVGNGPKYVHRLSFERYIRKPDPNMTIDHLCRNRICCNPAHLEEVTGGENTLRGESPSAVNKRKTECIRGHEFTPDNTYIRPNGHRICRTCHLAYLQRKAKARKK